MKEREKEKKKKEEKKIGNTCNRMKRGEGRKEEQALGRRLCNQEDKTTQTCTRYIRLQKRSNRPERIASDSNPSGVTGCLLVAGSALIKAAITVIVILLGTLLVARVKPRDRAKSALRGVLARAS